MKKVLLAVILTSCFTACNVTRVVSTEAKSYQNGDTCIYITTRTVETYDASKKFY